MEKFFDFPSRVIDQNCRFSHQYTREFPLIGKFHHCTNIFFGNCMASDYLISDQYISTIRSNISINKAFDIIEIIDISQRSSRRDKDFQSFLFSFLQRFYRRTRNTMSMKTHKRTVNIEKQGFNHSFFFIMQR